MSTWWCSARFLNAEGENKLRMILEKRRIESLVPAGYNPRKDLEPGDSEYEKIKQSLEEFGYVDPIIINQDSTIIGGHQRWKVLRDLGYDVIDCVIADMPKDYNAPRK